jgi:hypothetical protein
LFHDFIDEYFVRLLGFFFSLGEKCSDLFAPLQFRVCLSFNFVDLCFALLSENLMCVFFEACRQDVFSDGLKAMKQESSEAVGPRPAQAAGKERKWPPYVLERTINVRVPMVGYSDVESLIRRSGESFLFTLDAR